MLTIDKTTVAQSERQAQSESRERVTAARPGVTAVAWYPPTEMSFAQWVKQGRRLGLMGRSAGWWIGDWLGYGNAAYGERYARAARITGYDVHTLRNMVYVASRVEPSRRRDNLSWSHHAELVALSHEDQEFWLARAEQESLSLRDLRQAIRDERRGGRGCVKEAIPSPRSASEDQCHDDDEYDHHVVCPYCGQNFLPEEEQKVGLLASRH